MSMSNRRLAQRRLTEVWRDLHDLRSIVGVKQNQMCRDILKHFGVTEIPKCKDQLLEKALEASQDHRFTKLTFSLLSKPKKANSEPRTPKTKNPRPDKAFYSSWAWKSLRYEAIKANGRRCQCCGWTPDQGGDNHLVVDHIKPRKKFPELELSASNLQVLCNDCNMGKSDKHFDDFRDKQVPLNHSNKP